MELETSTNYGILPSCALSRAPPEHKYPLLFINLADLTSAEEAQTIRHLHASIKENALVQLWRPPKSAFPQPIPDKNRHMLKHYYKDSKANIFGLAVLAHRAGYKHFAVADEYSKRELRDELHSKETTSPGGHCVSLDRQDMDFRIIGMDNMDLFEQTHNYGVQLQDPNRAVFMSDSAAMTGREEFEMGAMASLLKSTPLPMELVNHIIGFLHDNDEELFGVPSVLRDEDLNIFLLFPASEDEQHRMQSNFQSEVDEYIAELEKERDEKRQVTADMPDNSLKNESGGTSSDSDGTYDSDRHEEYFKTNTHQHEIHLPANLTVRLISWKYSCVASRLDLERCWKSIHARGICPVNFLISSPLTAVYHNGECFMFISRNTVRRAVEHALRFPCPEFRAAEIGRELKKSGCEVHNPNDTEILYEPELPMYLVTSLWKRPGYSHIASSGCIVVFLLTNKLTCEQVAEMECLIEAPDSEDLEFEELSYSCHMVPWKPENKDEPDGSIDDIWKMFC
ncbi:hypothetical protein BJX99DRAFT_259254 [Aspergillus californicus]